MGSKCRRIKLLASGGFAGGEPFHDSELEAFAPLDLEPLGLDLAQRAAQHMLPWSGTVMTSAAR